MMRIALLSNINLDFVIKSLKPTYDVFDSSGYGSWVSYALDWQSTLVDFAPQTIFLILDGNAMVAQANTLEEKRTILVQSINYIDSMIQIYRDAVFFVSTLDIRTDAVFAADEMRHSVVLMDEWEKLLDTRIQSNLRMHRFELRNLVEDVGRRTMYSFKMWYMGGIPFDLNGLKFIAQEITSCLHKLHTNRKKVLVLDLDNTLWGGVVGEDGYDQIVLGPSHIGAIYQDVQRIVKQMIPYGVLIAVVSKNNIDDIYEVFDKNPHMILAKSDFVDICANWEEKSDNLRMLAQKLNLGLDSFVFIDDNVVERESVRLRLPEVVVPDFPVDLAVLPQTIIDVYKQYFWSWTRTAEDWERTTFYQDAVARSNAHANATSMDAYLQSLETVISISVMQPNHVDRVYQLINKTNQFNTNTVRMDIVQITKYCEVPYNRIFVVHVKDKFGDAGLVAVVMLRIDHSDAVIDNFLMSCRVMGRQIEHAVIAQILDYLLTAGVTKVHASYAPTAKNKPVSDLWSNLRFTETESQLPIKSYVWQDSSYAKSTIHTIRWG